MSRLLPELIHQMLEPGFYKGTNGKNIELIQTHISYLLIGEKYTYKIKKAVNLDFLDFTELKDRKHYCEEEVRLNSKLAPLIYLHTEAIYETGGRFSFEANNKTPVEYAVKMHTFDNQYLFSHLFETGKLTEATLENLGKRMAEHYEKTAHTSSAISDYGNPAKIKEVVISNFDVVSKHQGNTISHDDFEKLRNQSLQFIESHKDDFLQRMAMNKIKECHGDLHLRNICQYKKKIQVFDCIEFNPLFQNIDVLYDIAFLVMDLEYRNAHNLSYAFLNEYLEQSGDYEHIHLLPFYVAMRSFIRGLVAGIETTDSTIDPSQKEKARKEAEKYFQFTQACFEQKRPTLYVVMGLSGSGKTTLSKALCKKAGAIHLRSDAIRKHIEGVGLLDKTADIYTTEITRKTYIKSEELAANALAAGYNVVVDATFKEKEYREQIKSIAQKAGVTIRFILCEADADTLRHRVKNRKNDISDATVEVLERQLENFDRIDKVDMLVNTTAPDYLDTLYKKLDLV